MVLAAAVGAFWCIGCETSTSEFGPGLHLKLQVASAQLHKGGLGQESGGPEVSQVLRPQPQVMRGESGVALRGRLAPGGVALHIQAKGDPDHWVLLAKGADFVVADELQFAVSLAFSHTVKEEELTVWLQAADKAGRLGPITETTFVVSDVVPQAQLLISLAWDAPVDLDLLVTAPSGITIGPKNINSYEVPPGTVPQPGAWQDGGWLTFDSNQECSLDLRNREHIVWLHSKPPSGRYQVYAHLFSSCGQPFVNMLGVAQTGDEILARAGATQYEFDSRVHPAPGEAPGLLLMEFQVP